MTGSLQLNLTRFLHPGPTPQVKASPRGVQAAPGLDGGLWPRNAAQVIGVLSMGVSRMTAGSY